MFLLLAPLHASIDVQVVEVMASHSRTWVVAADMGVEVVSHTPSVAPPLPPAFPSPTHI